jgi:hypothetical protein
VFTPTTSGTVIPNNALGGAGGGQNITNHYGGDTISITCSKDYPADQAIEDVQKLRRNRIAMGIRTAS